MTGPCSESSGGFLVLVGLCFLIQPLVADMVRETVKGEQEKPAHLQKYTYTGRDNEGRPTWEYGYE